MLGKREVVLCPHCGAENQKSEIVTICYRCFQSLDGGAQAPAASVAAEPPAARAEVPVAPPVGLPPPPPPPPVAPEPVPPPPPASVPAQRIAPPATFAEPQAHSRWRRLVLVAVAFAVAAVLAARGSGDAAVVLIVTGALTCLLAWAWVAGTTYSVVADSAPRPIPLGGSLSWSVTVCARRAMTLAPGEIVLRCEEHCVVHGKGDRHYRRTIWEQRYPQAGSTLAPGEQATLHAEMTIPPALAPSFAARDHFVDWSVSLRAPVLGLLPSVRRQQPLWVQPSIAAGCDHGLPDDPEVPAAWAQAAPVRRGKDVTDLAHVLLTAVKCATVSDVPAVPLGASREVDLWVQLADDVKCRDVDCWIGCRIHGRWARSEEIALLEDKRVFEGWLPPSEPFVRRITLHLPDDAPASYLGQYVECEWMVRVRLGRSLWRDIRLEAPFLVTPRLLPASPESVS